MIDLHKIPHFPCSQCDSQNTKLESPESYMKMQQAKDASFFKKMCLTVSAKAHNKAMEKSRSGKWMVICQDCGHVGMVMVR